MHDTAERIKRVKLRVRKLQRASESRLINALSALCIVLSFSLVGVIGVMTGSSWGTVSGFYGTMLLYEDAGGYVLVGVIAFAVAVIITTLCLRYRENIKKVSNTSRNVIKK